MSALETNEMKEKILQNDPLYSVLQNTPLEETIYTDAQLRYYIKPCLNIMFLMI